MVATISSRDGRFRQQLHYQREKVDLSMAILRDCKMGDCGNSARSHGEEVRISMVNISLYETNGDDIGLNNCGS